MRGCAAGMCVINRARMALLARPTCYSVVKHRVIASIVGLSPHRWIISAHGSYARTRELLDYTWHVTYSAERQRTQDDIISKCLSVPAPRAAASPFLVFTAGPMGGGKSYTMRNLHQRGLFPLDRFVVVDPDRIKNSLLEMDAYRQQDPQQAATLMHKESGYIAEIVEREAMLQRRNVLVDGSLRNVDWYARSFGRIRAEFPEYVIAIVLITASRERIFARAQRRAAVTGRVVPAHVLDDAIVQVPKSFATLAPLADFTAELHNDDDAQPPRLVQPQTEEEFRALWQSLEAPA